MSKLQQPKINARNKARMSKGFNVVSICRADLEWHGFDTSKVDDGTMENLADDIGDALAESLVTAMEIMANNLEFQRHKKKKPTA